jgi:hypothetical protein
VIATCIDADLPVFAEKPAANDADQALAAA